MDCVSSCTIAEIGVWGFRMSDMAAELHVESHDDSGSLNQSQLHRTIACSLRPEDMLYDFTLTRAF
jgi:hypothetical protein